MSFRITAVIAAAGSGTRMGGKKNKIFMPVLGKPVITYTMEALSQCDEIDDFVIVTRECDIDECIKYTKDEKKPVKVIKGGKTRQESVYLGISEAKDADIVVIHDGARALVLPEIVKKTISDAIEFDAAATGVMSKDSLKKVDSDGFIEKTIDRQTTCLIQTPQIFKREAIIKAHELAVADEFFATDDCAIYERYIGRIKLSAGSYENIKLTTPDDMIIAENILKRRRKAL